MRYGRNISMAVNTIEAMKEMKLDQTMAIATPDKVLVFKLVEINEDRQLQGKAVNPNSIVYDEMEHINQEAMESLRLNASEFSEALKGKVAVSHGERGSTKIL